MGEQRQGLGAAIAGFTGAAINLGTTIFMETRDAYHENVGRYGGRKNTSSSSSSSSSSFYRRMTRGDPPPPPPSTQYAYAQPSSELQKQLEMGGSNSRSIHED